MKKTQSLCLNHRFRQLYGKGKSQVTPTIVVYCSKNRTPQENRLGITVSTKIGCAVVRNRVRRKIREAYRLHEHKLVTGWDMVIVARTRAPSAQFKHIEKDLLFCLKKLSLMAGETNEKAGTIPNQPL